MLELQYTNSYIRSIIIDELLAFPGVTKTMLNVRMKIRLKKSSVPIMDQMIEDGEIIERYKHIPNLQKPVKVLYLSGNDDCVAYIPMVDSKLEQEQNDRQE